MTRKRALTFRMADAMRVRDAAFAAPTDLSWGTLHSLAIAGFEAIKDDVKWKEEPTTSAKVDVICKAIHENANAPSMGDVAVEILKALDWLAEHEHEWKVDHTKVLQSNPPRMRVTCSCGASDSVSMEEAGKLQDA